MARQAVSLRNVAALVFAFLAFSTVAGAQTAPGSIAGVARDTSGAILPGVTVEAASPALIEKVRTVITDGQGQYKIVDLRPGVYSVTFALTGFAGVKYEGIQLSSGFTATINADMKVGGLEESITVSGQSPLVDVQNAKAQQVITEAIMQTIPTTRGFSAFVVLNPGIRSGSTSQDVGGAQNENAFAASVWGSRQGEFRVLLDGMPTYGTGRARGIMLNTATATESNLSLGGATADTEVSGVLVNLIPKEGGNSFSGFFLVNGASDNLQSDNLTDEVRGRGLTRVNKIGKVFDFNSTVGGPLARNRVWFFAAARRWGSDRIIGGNYWNATQSTPVYTPDLTRPTVKTLRNRDFTGRLTWQASPRNKVNFQHVTEKIEFIEGIDVATVYPEAAPLYEFYPDTATQATWTSPVSQRFLLEAGGQYFNYHYKIRPQPGVKPTDISIQELSTGYAYNALGAVNASGAAYGNNIGHLWSSRFSASYVTGSHAFKAGVQTQSGFLSNIQEINGDVTYAFLNGAPVRLTQRATPIYQKNNLRINLGIYAQDQWTIRRLTLNLGLRYDYFDGYIPDNSQPATRFLPARNLPGLDHTPQWKDVNVRVGAAYDLFGDGRTAIKGSMGRYIVGDTVSIQQASNPVATIVNNVTRTWTDANRNFVPDCDLRSAAATGECGPLPNNTFGTTRVTTRYSDEVTRGYGQRPFNWLTMGELQHQLSSRISAKVGYIHRWYGNFAVTENRATTPGDFDPYSITAPLDARLPGGGGNVITGLYDVKPARFGQVDNLVSLSGKFGKQIERADFISLQATARLPRGATVSGGFDVGRTVTDNCNVVTNNPQLAFSFVADPTFSGAGSLNPGRGTAPRMEGYCRIVTPWSAQRQFKVFGSHPLPLEFQVSANFQSSSGIPITAIYNAPNAVIAPSLGRNLAAGANGIVSIDLIAPQTRWEGRINQLDFRLSKIVRLGRTRLEGQIDLYNALNGSPILSANQQYGPSWLRPIQILDGRIVKFGFQLTF